MKKHISKIAFTFLILCAISCQKEEDDLPEEELLSVNKENDSVLEKNYADAIVLCSIEAIPPGYSIVEYIIANNCPYTDLYFGTYNAVIVERISTPAIITTGAGCDDNFCIWIKGNYFEENAYVDIRSTHGSVILGTYRDSDRHQYVNNQGQDVITLRLRSQYEKDLFASTGLRIWVVNPIARKWADGRIVRRPGGDIGINPDDCGGLPCP